MVKVIDQFHFKLTDEEKKSLLSRKKEIVKTIQEENLKNENSKCAKVSGFKSYYYSFTTYDLANPTEDLDKTIELITKFLPLTKEEIKDLRNQRTSDFNILLDYIDNLLEL